MDSAVQGPPRGLVSVLTVAFFTATPANKRWLARVERELGRFGEIISEVQRWPINFTSYWFQWPRTLLKIKWRSLEFWHRMGQEHQEEGTLLTKRFSGGWCEVLTVFLSLLDS